MNNKTNKYEAWLMDHYEYTEKGVIGLFLLGAFVVMALSYVAHYYAGLLWAPVENFFTDEDSLLIAAIVMLLMVVMIFVYLRKRENRKAVWLILTSWVLLAGMVLFVGLFFFKINAPFVPAIAAVVTAVAYAFIVYLFVYEALRGHYRYYRNMLFERRRQKAH